jgi:hypothetical protein
MDITHSQHKIDMWAHIKIPQEKEITGNYFSVPTSMPAMF